MATSVSVTPRIEVFLLLNGHEIDASVDEQEHIIIDVASGKVSRIELGEWLREHLVVRNR
jgi:death-on-curing protein